MKYIRLFEEKEFESKTKTPRYYWLLPTDYKFEDSLRKIGCPEYKIRLFLDNNYIPKDYFVFIGLAKYTDIDSWGWNNYEGSLNSRYYDETDYDYKGIINIEDWEFEVKTMTNKYNI